MPVSKLLRCDPRAQWPKIYAVGNVRAQQMRKEAPSNQRLHKWQLPELHTNFLVKASLGSLVSCKAAPSSQADNSQRMAPGECIP